MTKTNTLDHFLANVVEKPQVFFASNQKIADSAIEMAKHFYDNGTAFFYIYRNTLNLPF